MFPKDYDWKEDERIHNALHDLYQDSSVDLWEELIQKAQDARYCETSWDAGEEARIHSVGDVCRNLAYLRLTDVYASHLPSLPPHGCPIHFEKIRSNLPAWRKERGGKALYQLQIEVAEMAIGKLSGTDALPLSAQEKATARKGIEADVMKLKRTKEAIFRDHPGYGTRYTPGLAKRIRKAVDTGSGEDIDLEK